MKTMLLLVVCSAFLVDICADNTAVTKVPVQSIAHDTISFAKQIQPILQKNCSPCHFTGGKMYERMPFDASATLLSHAEGILKRIKTAEENKLLKDYIAQRGR
jgi:hypothetical protein